MIESISNISERVVIDLRTAFKLGQPYTQDNGAAQLPEVIE